MLLIIINLDEKYNRYITIIRYILLIINQNRSMTDVSIDDKVVSDTADDQDTITYIKNTAASTVRKLSQWQYIFIYGSIIAMTIIVATASYFGAETTWYQNLIKPVYHTWTIRAAWVISTILSYVGLFILWKQTTVDNEIEDYRIDVFYLINTFISLSWAISYYYAENLGLAFWLSIGLFTFKFWLMLYIWYLNPLAAVFFVPIVIMNLFLVYTTVHIANVNQVPL